MSELLYILLVLAVFWFWMDSSRSRERAVNAAREACKQAGVQFLDDTVMLAKIRMCRKSSGSMALCRSYSFDFSLDGEQRRSGSVSMRAQTLIDLVLDVDHVSVIQ